MSRATSDRGCGNCGWKAEHVPEDFPYKCPECGFDIIGRPVPFDYARFLQIKAEQEMVENANLPVPRIKPGGD